MVKAARINALRQGVRSGECDPLPVTHDEALAWCAQLVRDVSPATAGAWFATSLVGRELARRTAFYCYVLASRLSEHSHVPLSGDVASEADRGYCDKCFGESVHEVELAELRKRVARAGVFFYAPADCAAVLEHELANGSIEADEPAREAMVLLVATVDGMQRDASANDLEKALAKVFRSNRQERRDMIELLVSARILKADQPARHVSPRTDWSDAAVSWRGRDGWQRAAAERYFPWLGLLGSA